MRNEFFISQRVSAMSYLRGSQRAVVGECLDSDSLLR